jgi:CYTH domain
MAEIERERRFRLDQAAYENIVRRLPWSAPEVVTDVTMGPHGSLSMSIDGWVVRLRAGSGYARMQLKKRQHVAHEYLEVDLEVDSISRAAEMLMLMGMQPGLVISRTRRQASVPGALLTLDDINLLGYFIEIEETDSDKPALPAFLHAHLTRDNERGAYGDLIISRMQTDSAWAEAYRKEAAELLKSMGLGDALNTLTGGSAGTG